jgi:hypothetical protein
MSSVPSAASICRWSAGRDTRLSFQLRETLLINRQLGGESGLRNARRLAAAYQYSTDLDGAVYALHLTIPVSVKSREADF